MENTCIARTNYKCCYCNNLIEVGEEYQSMFIEIEGKACIRKSHINCGKLIEKLGIDKGIFEFDLMWEIAEEYQKIFPNSEINGTTPDFRFEKVKQHYKL